MKKYHLLLFVVALVISSCVTADITSKKDPSFNEKLDDVLIIMRGAEKANLFLETLGQNMDSTFALHGVTSHHYVAKGVKFEKQSLDLKSDQEKAEELKRNIEKQVLLYGPEYILYVRQTMTKKASNNIGMTFERGGIFDFQLFKKDKEGMIWRAELDMYTEQGPIYSAKVSNREIFEKLVYDRLIDPLPGSSSYSY